MFCSRLLRISGITPGFDILSATPTAVEMRRLRKSSSAMYAPPWGENQQPSEKLTKASSFAWHRSNSTHHYSWATVTYLGRLTFCFCSTQNPTMNQIAGCCDLLRSLVI